MQETPKKAVRPPRKTSPRSGYTPANWAGSSEHLSQKMKELWADPARRAALLIKREAALEKRKGQVRNRTELGRTPRIPDGMRLHQAKRFWRQAKFEATLTMKKLEAAGVLDDADEQARAALHHAITIMRDQTTGAKDGLVAARLVLDFTKAKPAQKSEVTISKAEDWLAAVTADNAEADKGPTSSA